MLNYQKKLTNENHDAMASSPDWRVLFAWLETLQEEANLCSLSVFAREEKRCQDDPTF